MSTIVFFIHILLFLASTVAFNDVSSIDITTWDGTINTVQITLWFNYTIYQHALPSPVHNYTYSITTFTTLGPSDCHKSPSATPEAKIMIESGGEDAWIIDRIAFHTSSGSWYGISGRCVDDALLAAQSWLYDATYSSYTEDELSCDSGTTNVLFCIDNQNDDCRPTKQVFYFDSSRVNEFIPDATWSDGTNVIPEIVSCDPTSRPTNNPTSDTINPTKAPSVSPTPMPTSYPSQPPSDKPTFSPTNPPITMNPTAFAVTNHQTGTPSATRDTIYATQSTESSSFLQSEKPLDIILILSLSLIGFSFINILIIFLFVLFLRHKKRVSAHNEQQMADDEKKEEVDQANALNQSPDTGANSHNSSHSEESIEDLYIKYDEKSTAQGINGDDEDEDKISDEDGEEFYDNEAVVIEENIFIKTDSSANSQNIVEKHRNEEFASKDTKGSNEGTRVINAALVISGSAVMTKGSAAVKEGVVRKSRDKLAPMPGAVVNRNNDNDEINIENVEVMKRTIEGSESNSNDLWNKSLKVEDNETRKGNTITGNGDKTQGASNCVDCGLLKAGRVYQGDQLFYCCDCLVLYD